MPPRVLVSCCNSTLPDERDDHLRVVAAPGRRVEAAPGSALRAPPGAASTLQGPISTTPLDVTPYAEVAHAVNGRLLEALARVPLTGAATAELDALDQPVTATRVAAFNPIHSDTANLFAAVLSGDFTVNGFRKKNLQGKLYLAAATDGADARRQTYHTSRLIVKLRKGLITRVKNSRLIASPPKASKPCGPPSASAVSTSPPLSELSKPHRNFRGHVNSWRGIA